MSHILSACLGTQEVFIVPHVGNKAYCQCKVSVKDFAKQFVLKVFSLLLTVSFADDVSCVKDF